MLPTLYPILDVDLCRGRGLDPLAVLDAFLAGGARFLQWAINGGTCFCMSRTRGSASLRTRGTQDDGFDGFG